MSSEPQKSSALSTFCRSFPIYFLTVFWTAFYWTAMLLPVGISLLFPRCKRRHFMRFLLFLFGWTMVRIVWRPFFRVRYEDHSGCGKDRAPGIVVVNHRAATDAFLVAVMGESCAQTVNGWPMRAPVIGWGAKLGGYLDITGWDFATLEKNATEVIAENDVIVAFPEGTRSESEKMNAFHSGIFKIALDLGLPVYMLCIAGNEYMPDRKFRFRMFRDLLIRRLAPIPADEVGRCATAFVLKKTVFRKMEEELAKMDELLKEKKS